MNPGSLASGDDHPASRPPGWLIAVTALLALAVLAMAVAETNLWLHYLIDAGEPFSLIGLALATLAGLVLYRQRRLRASLPLMVPWLLFPIITQGDQIIDNLSINWMRFIVHVLLGLIFGIPVAVVVAGARVLLQRPSVAPAARRSRFLAVVPGLSLLAAGRTREGGAVLAVFLIALLTWVAVQFLGLLMVVTLIGMAWGVLVWGFWPETSPRDATGPVPVVSERRALWWLLAGVAISLVLFVAYKNRPGAYQGSPAFFMDPAQERSGPRIDARPVGQGTIVRPATADDVQRALATYGQAFERLLAGYYILDRNYNYDFHNRLFLRSTPLLPDYRASGLRPVHEAVALRETADRLVTDIDAGLATDDPIRTLLDDVRDYAAFTFDRAPVLERMSDGFDDTQAGLQHATHLYEGEGKMLSVRLAELLTKHQRVLASAEIADLTGAFAASARAVHDAYANRIVGF